MNNIINERNLKVAHREGTSGNSHFNCWGATLYVLGKADELYWSDNDEILEFIVNETFAVSYPKKGDIIVLYGDRDVDFDSEDEVYGILHTAVFLGKDKWFHKRGGSQSEFVTEEEIKDIYFEYQDIEYRRVGNI